MNKQNYRIFLAGVIALFIMLLGSCAKIVAPTGGPKDETPPKIAEIKPANYSTSFESDEINIKFDEFIQLKDINNNLIISPPVDEKPEIMVKGKTLNIKMKSWLKDSTTYNIYFGNSVQDFNEGNPIENFQYVFSTGSYIDSLSVEGQVIDAFTLLPQEGIFVMLYDIYEDSVPLKSIPRYVSKTNKDGFFKINNIRDNHYKVFCTNDLNKNFKYDMLNEKIAFGDTLISFHLIKEFIVDTIYKADSLLPTNDSSLALKQIDTIITHSKEYFQKPNYIFRLFEENKKVQYLSNSKRDQMEKLEFMFNKPIKDSISIALNDSLIYKNWFLKETNKTNDTITYWITDSLIYNREQLNVLLAYQKEDSNLVYQWVTDTLKLKYFETKKKKGQEPDTIIQYDVNVKNNGIIDLNNNIRFTFERPLQYVDSSKISLFSVVDTIEMPAEFSVFRDSINLRKINIQAKWPSDTAFKLIVLPEAFYDVYGLTNDTLEVKFRSQKLDFYGKILANVVGVDSSFQLITQLIVPGKDNEQVFLEKVIQNSQVVEFPFLPPKEFIFKVIIDKNFNGKWDTGDYLKHIQPEEVLYHTEKVKVRSNWDMEINFNVKKQ